MSARKHHNLLTPLHKQRYLQTEDSGRDTDFWPFQPKRIIFHDSPRGGPEHVRNRRMQPGEVRTGDTGPRNDIPTPLPGPGTCTKTRLIAPVCPRFQVLHSSRHQQPHGPTGHEDVAHPGDGNVKQGLRCTCDQLQDPETITTRSGNSPTPGYSGQAPLRITDPLGQCGTPGARTACGGQPSRRGERLCGRAKKSLTRP